MDTKAPPEKTITLTSSAGTVQTIGPYHLLQKIGEGGMGEVWEAEQHKPIRRKVALKLIKAGMDTRQVIARFESERQALAMMDHPAIAKVFDAGETPEGRPYFVMEYVQGIPITTYCDQNRLTTHERLALFSRACEGVQHAHQKAIIHRDLKPSNILVAIQDGKAVPKIIDFGVAKATAQSLTERTMFTELGMLIGTPEYMSPEQAEMSGQNIDTRTDIYSLGAILYELLTGALPFDPKELRRAGFDEIRRKIRVEDPPRPSTRLSTMGDASAVSAANRRTEPPALIRQVRGDLDWITMKALEKDQTRRYGSASEMAADIDRYLEHQPVTARPPRATYKAAKFVRRHRLGVGVASSLAVLLVAFSVTTAVQSRRIVRERDRANREAETSKQVSEFLTGLFRVSDPSEARGNSITAREILDRAAREIEGRLAAQPLVKARLEMTLADVYDALGLYDPALSFAEKSLELRRKQRPAENTTVAESLYQVGCIRLDRGEYDRALPALRDAAEIQEKVLGPESPTLATTLSALGNYCAGQGKVEEARTYYLRALRIREKVLPPDSPDLAVSLDNLAWLYNQEGNFAQAEPLMLRALAIDEKALGPNHPYTASLLNNLAMLYRDQGKYAQAEALLRRVIAIDERTLSPDHPGLAPDLDNLANLYQQEGKYGQAESLFARSLTIREKALGPDHPHLAMSLNNLAMLFRDEGKYGQAEPLLLRAVAINEKALGREHPHVAILLNNLAALYRDERKYAQAEPLMLRAVAIDRKAGGSESVDTAEDLVYLAELYVLEGKSGQAGPLLDSALRVFEKTPPKQTHGRYCHVKALALAGRTAEAREKAQELYKSGYRRTDFLQLCNKLGIKTGA